LYRNCFASKFANFRGDAFGCGEVAIGDRNVGALFSESDRGGASDATRAAGDQCILVFESQCHLY
jgi:hypothetical protein